MSFFGSLFGKAPAPAPAAPTGPVLTTEQINSQQTREAIQTLNQKKEMVQKRQQLLEARMNKCTEEARAKMAKSDKKGAMQALKRKKLFEAEAQKYEGAILNLEKQVIMLESASMDVTVMSAYKQTGATMKQIQKSMDVDQVAEVMDDLTEAMEDQEEISNQIGREIGTSMGDADVEAEFEAMCAGAMEEEFLSVPGIHAPAAGLPEPELSFPAVPSSALPAPAPARAPTGRVAVAAGAAHAAPARAAPVMDADEAALAAEFA